MPVPKKAATAPSRARAAAKVAQTPRSQAAKAATKEPTAVHKSGSNPLDEMIPEQWCWDDYIPRSIDGILDISYLDYAFKTKENVLLFGDTGPGKTSCVFAYASYFKRPIVSVPCNGAIDPNYLFGRQILEPDGVGGSRVVYIESMVTQAMRYGGIIYLDEVNFAPARVMSVLHGALDFRRQVTIPELGNLTFTLHPSCQFIATMNIGYEGTKPLNKAFRNRFSIPLEFDYERAIEEQLVTRCPSMLDLAEKLRDQVKTGELVTPVATNMLMEFENHAIDLSAKIATSLFVNHFQAHERAAVRGCFEHFATNLENESNAARIAANQTGDNK